MNKQSRKRNPAPPWKRVLPVVVGAAFCVIILGLVLRSQGICLSHTAAVREIDSFVADFFKVDDFALSSSLIVKKWLGYKGHFKRLDVRKNVDPSSLCRVRSLSTALCSEAVEVCNFLRKHFKILIACLSCLKR